MGGGVWQLNAKPTTRSSLSQRGGITETATLYYGSSLVKRQRKNGDGRCPGRLHACVLTQQGELRWLSGLPRGVQQSRVLESADRVSDAPISATVGVRKIKEFSPGPRRPRDVVPLVAARSVEVAGTPVHLSRLEFELLAKFAADPGRVCSKQELARCIWRCEISGRTVESHVARLRTRLASAGAHDVLVNTWGHGRSLTRPH